MKTSWKKYGVLLAAGGMAVCMAAGLGIGIQWSGSYTEKMVAEAAGNELQQDEEHGPQDEETDGIMESVQSEPWENHLYKDEVLDEEIARKVCGEYNLDYDTVLLGEVTREMRNYEEALWLLKEMGSRPLLDGGLSVEDDGISTLQGYICNIYAFSGGGAVIRDQCAEFGIDPDKSVVSDLTTEQLIQIGEAAYETSDHPKE